MSARNEFPPRRWEHIHAGVAPNRDARWRDVPSSVKKLDTLRRLQWQRFVRDNKLNERS